jgi:hypothetical protein
MSWTLNSETELSTSSTPNFPLGKRAYTECSGEGNCDRSTGICGCFEGFSGIGCRRSQCPNNCSGNGICVLESSVKDFYARNKLLLAQKEYWNSAKTQRCICDSHFWGNDCSARLCPQGVDPDIEDCDNIQHAKDVQLVTVSIGNDLELMEYSHIDQYFTLTFTDAFDAQVTTKPISFWADADYVQEALLSLPNFAIQDVEVHKFFPLNDYDGTVVPDRGTTLTSTLQSEGFLREIACERLHFDLFSNTGCADDSDCVSGFGLNETFLFCDVNILQCVETDRSSCEVSDGIMEFKSDLGCAQDFEPNGIYQDSNGIRWWGRRLTAADKSCHVGNFASSDTRYAQACRDDFDCVACTGVSQIRAGVCNEGLCGISDEYKAVMAQEAINECRVAAWTIKFSALLNTGTQSLFSCTHGSLDTFKDGASPRFLSAGIISCDIVRAGVPEWQLLDAGQNYEEGYLCYDTDDTLATTASFTTQDDAVDGMNSTDSSSTNYDICFRLSSTNDLVDDINLVIADQNAAIIVSQPTADMTDFTTLKGLDYKNKPLFSADEIESVADTVYNEVLPCANEGACEADGTCTCRDGFYGSSCEMRLDYL